MDNLDYDTALDLARQRARQYGGQMQYQSPQGQMVGGRYIAPNPLQYIAEGLRSFGGMRGEQMAQDEMKQLTEGRRQAVADALRGYIEKSQGTPENVAADGMGPTRPAQLSDMKAGYEHLMQSGVPQLTQAGLQGYMQMPALEAQQRERDEARTYRAQEAQLTREARMQEAQLARDARMQELQFKLADARAGQTERLAAQKELKQMILSGQKETRQIIGGTQDKPTYDKELGGFVYKPTAQDPQGKIVPLPNSTGQRDAKNALKVIAQAEGLLDKATGSYGGVAADEVARVFGVSTPGARGAAQLKALEGELISKMPKMAGPQSDKDVLLYKQMAGQIGDPTIPADTKRSALEAIKQIQSRYAGVSNVPKDAPQPSAGPSITDLLKKY